MEQEWALLILSRSMCPRFPLFHLRCMLSGNHYLSFLYTIIYWLTFLLLSCAHKDFSILLKDSPQIETYYFSRCLYLYINQSLLPKIVLSAPDLASHIITLSAQCSLTVIAKAVLFVTQPTATACVCFQLCAFACAVPNI